VVYVFPAPVQEEHVSDGLRLTLEILENFGNGKDPGGKYSKYKKSLRGLVFDGGSKND
jgi:hypothetical protein